MNDINNFLSGLYGIINIDFPNLSNQDGRRALIYLLGNNNNAIVAADILIYLIYQTFTTSPDLLEQYDGFIVRTYSDIESAVGCSNLMNCRTPLKLLKDKGLIKTNNNSEHRRSCYRVDISSLIEQMDEAYEALGKYREKCRETYMENHRPSTYNDPVNWEEVNDHLIEGQQDVEYFRERGIKVFDIEMMFYVQKYWKETYGEDYKWSRGEFYTLSKNLTSKGVKRMMMEDVEKLRDAIQTLDEVDWLTKAYTARKIIMRMNGYKKFKKKGENR